MTAITTPHGEAFSPADVHRARHAPGLLGLFNAAGILDLADIHVSRCLADLTGENDPSVGLATALAVRAPRLGHVCVDLATVSSTVVADVEDLTADVDIGPLPWPEPGPWLARLVQSPLVLADAGGPPDRAAGFDGEIRTQEPGAGRDGPIGDPPLRLVGTRLYLDRYWRQEQLVGADLRARAQRSVGEVDLTVLRAGLDRLFGPSAAPLDLQRLAAGVTILRRLSVIAGGPGTGKTTTVARIVALLAEQAQARDQPLPRVALAAPTGRAAARLGQAVRDGAPELDISDGTRRFLLGLGASTLHRLLGWRPGSHSRFRHDSQNRLPHDVVIVDETSMVSLSLMAKLVDAVRADARLVLVGDPEQLVSVEAGAVLGDVVGAARQEMRMRSDWRAQLEGVVGAAVPAGDATSTSGFGDGVVVLRRVHRFGGAVGTLASAVQQGDGDATVAALRNGGDHVRWLDADTDDEPQPQDNAAALAPVRQLVVDNGRRLHQAALAGDTRIAAACLTELRVLCAHRRGPAGVDRWTDRIERWLRSAIDGYGRSQWYPGQPLLVTENDYELGLYNGDTGVVISGPHDVPVAAFERDGHIVELSPTRLRAIETMHAMTVHKGQGSQYQTVVLVLPEPGSPVLTRQLLYTAVTRAQRRLLVVGTESGIRAGVARPVARASGLGGLLWGTAETPGDGPPARSDMDVIA